MSVDKLEEPSFKDTFDREYMLRVALVVVIIIGSLVGGLIYFSDNESELSGDESFEIQYSDAGVLVTQTSGDTVGDSVKVRLNYRNGEQTMRNISIDNLNDTEIVIVREEIYQLESSDIVLANGDKTVQVIDSQELTDDYAPKPPEVTSEQIDMREGESVKLDAGDYVESELEITGYEWKTSKQYLNPTGSVPSGTDQTIGDETTVLRFDESGDYFVHLTVTDSLGNQGTGTFDVSVKSPSLFTSSSDLTYKSTVGEPFSLDATDVTTTEATNYSWTVGDNKYNSRDITHTFESKGMKQIGLTVEDSSGYEATRTLSVQVVEKSSLDLTYESTGGSEYRFTADTSGVSVDEYRWDLGNGVSDKTNTPVTSYSYDSDGSHTITVTAVTSNGASLSDTVTIEESSDIEIEMSSNRGRGWSVDSVDGVSTDQVLPNDDIGDTNPDIQLERGETYVFDGLNREHPIVFRDLFGDPVLSQSAETAYEDDAGWSDSGDRVSFTVTEELPSVLDGYQSVTNPSSMDGQIVFDD